jgi:ribosome-binding factor A
MTQRTDRIDELLRQEIGELLGREIADPAIGFVTVTRVETSPDLAHARVWVSVIGQRGERRASLFALRRAMPYIRHQLSDRVRLRRIPDLHVELDETAERGTRVLQLLHELEEGKTPEELVSTGESLPTPVARIRPPDEPEPPAPGGTEAPPKPASRTPRQPRGRRPGHRSGPGRDRRR